MRHVSSTAPTRGGSSPDLPRAQDADSGAGRARQSDQGVALAQGISEYEPLLRKRRERLEELSTDDGRPLSAGSMQTGSDLGYGATTGDLPWNPDNNILTHKSPCEPDPSP
jgi:hypothetical protein